jgi:hypothetical protein
MSSFVLGSSLYRVSKLAIKLAISTVALASISFLASSQITPIIFKGRSITLQVNTVSVEGPSLSLEANKPSKYFRKHS